MEQQGYVTVATRARRHAEMAIDLALSLRAVGDPRPICALVDHRTRPLFDDPRIRPFVDAVVDVPASHRYGHAAKLWVAEGSPWDRSVFLDADILLLETLHPLWEQLEGSGFVMMGDFCTPSRTLRHHGVPTDHLARRFGLDRYFMAFSPLFAFDPTEGRSVLRDVFSIYDGPLRHPRYWRWDARYPPDEIAFSVVGSRRDIGRFPPFHALMSREEAATWAPGTVPRPAFHAIYPPTAEALDHLMEAVRSRREAADLPPTSERYWRRKLRAKRWQRLPQELLSRLGRRATRAG